MRSGRGGLRDRETRVFGTVSARGTLYPVRGSLYRMPVPAWVNPDFALTLAARALGYRSVYVRDAQCLVACERSLRRSYARTVRAVAQDVATLLRTPGLLDPRRYGAFAWMLMGHKLGRWLAPWALMTGVAGLLLLATTEPWARATVEGALAVGLLAAATSFLPVRGPLRRAGALLAHVAATTVAIAYASVKAVRAMPHLLLEREIALR